MGNNFARPKDDYENTEVYKSIKSWALSDQYRSDKYGFKNTDTYKNFLKKRACCTGNNDYNIPFPALVPNKDMDLIDRNNKYLTKQDNDTTYSQMPINIDVFDSIITNGDERCKLDGKINISSNLNISKNSNNHTQCSNFYNKFADDVMEQNNMYGRNLYYGLYNSISSSDNTNSYNKNYNIDLFCVNSQFKHDPELKKIPGLSDLDTELTAQAFDKLCSDNKNLTYKKTAEMPTINICSIATSISDSGRINAKNFNLTQSCNQNNNEKPPEHKPDDNSDDEIDDKPEDKPEDKPDNNSNKNNSNKNKTDNDFDFDNNLKKKTDKNKINKNNFDDTDIDTDSNTFLDFVKNNYILIIILFIVFIFIIILFIILYNRNSNSNIRVRRNRRNRNYE
jgi:hypothetical protein